MLAEFQARSVGEGFTADNIEWLVPTHSGIMTVNMVSYPVISVLCETYLASGLIRWKIVIHGFIDGKSRLVVGIRAHNNNRADTVLKLFLDATFIHGTPSRVRGDHGTENVRVAEWMEENQGSGRGSYIWGRFVHSSNSLDYSSYSLFQ